MKTLATLALALSLSLTACAAEDDYTGELGPRPAGKPSLDTDTPPDILGTPSHPDSNTVSISEDRDIGSVAGKPQFDDGRLIEWAEIDGNRVHVHKLDLVGGLDEITTYDELGDIVVVENRAWPREELDIDGRK